MKIATFTVDVTPPIGHPLCGGWVGPALGITHPLAAKGIVLDNGDGPVLLLAIDWCEISNRTHLAWRTALASAVGTSSSRVTVHTMHPHCTPWPDEYAQSLASQYGDEFAIMDAAWCAGAFERVAEGARTAMGNLQNVTHLTTGRAKVESVASNRRIMGDDGTIKAVRWTRTTDPEVRAEPEGLVDPWLKTIAFWNGEAKLAVLHYYAVHPTSYDDAHITPDFTGLARERRQVEDGGIPHIYFTECAGNITAGKYNDGATENREVLTERVHRAMVESEEQMHRVDIDGFEWRTTSFHLAPRPDMNVEDLTAIMDDRDQHPKARCRAALMLAYLERNDLPIEVSALHFGDAISLLHLPGESFMEYQHLAQSLRPNSMVCVPAYADCGPGYICMESSFAEGGYEPQDSFVAPESEAVMRQIIACVM